MPTVYVKAPEDPIPEGMTPISVGAVIVPKRLNITGLFQRQFKIGADDVKPQATFTKEENMRPGDYELYFSKWDEPVRVFRLTPEQRLKATNYEIIIPWHFVTKSAQNPPGSPPGGAQPI